MPRIADDVLDGGDDDDELHGLAGNDVLYRGSGLRPNRPLGNDLVYGRTGRDVLYSDMTGKAQGLSIADDVLDGGEDDDELHAHPVFAALV